MSERRRQRAETSGPTGPGQSGISAAAPSRLNRLLVMLGVLLAGVVVSRLRRLRTTDPASALHATFADRSLFPDLSVQPASHDAETTPSPDGSEQSRIESLSNALRRVD